MQTNARRRVFLLLIVLSVFMLGATILTAVFAATRQDFATQLTATYNPINSEMTINSSGVVTVTKLRENLFVPSEINGITVTSIGTDLTYDEEEVLKRVSLPNTLKELPSFESCYGLEVVIFAENSQFTSIGDYAFSCTSLISIEIPASVTSIGESAFGATNLTSIEVVEGNTIYHSAGNCLIETASKTLILGCNTSIIPTDGSVTSIADFAFDFCTDLTSIEIPASVTTIGEQAFDRCTGLTSVTFAENSQLTSIGPEAFWGCTSLTSIEISASVTTIGGSAFYGCTSLTSVTFAENSQLTEIEDSAFSCCSSLTSIEIPASVTTIGEKAFDFCADLTSIEIPASVISIKEEVLRGCTSLISIEVEEGNTVYHSVGNCIIETESKTLVAGCKNSVIPTDGSVTTIGSNAFDSCTSLTSIVIPDSVTSIGYCAFSGCAGLTSIEIPASVTTIGSHAFQHCTGLTSIEIPASVTSIGYGAFSYCKGLTSVTFAEDSQLISIGDSAFNYCTSLKNATFAGNSQLTSIGQEAFQGTGLTSIVIPASVTSIEYYAFRQCTSLINVTFENKTGWKAGSTTITETQLSNTATAATLLKSTYYKYSWTRTA